jgi:flagellar motor switch protein FliN
MAEQNQQTPQSETKDEVTEAPQAPAESSSGSAAAEPSPEEALEAASRAAEEIKRETGDGSDDGANASGTDKGNSLELEDFGSSDADQHARAGIAGLNLLDDIDLQVTVELGRTRMYVEDVLRLNENSVVELDKAAGDSVDIYVNDRLVARGEVLVLNENFCVRINEIISQQALDECEAAVLNERG